MMAKRKTGGRPSTYTDEVADLICTRIAEGESVRAITRDETMPCMSTVFKWLRENDAFSQQYARAVEIRADSMFDEMFEIADDASNDWMEKRGENSEGWQLNGEHVQRSRLRIDTRKWALARMAPKKYGDKLDLNHGGQNGENPVKVVTRIEMVAVHPDVDGED